MALDASQILGSPQLAGVRVSPRGSARRIAKGSNPALRFVRDNEPCKPDQTPPFGLNGYLAVTDHELALIGLRMGWRNLRIDHVVTRIPRRAVASVELGDAPNAPLTVTLGNGERWELEVPTFYGGQAKKVAAALA